MVYKQRKRKTTTSLKDRSFRKDRGYKEFLEYIAANKSVYVVEMDTVEGAKGTSPCFLTMFFRNCSLMLMFLLEEQTQKEVTRIFDHLTELLGIELFQKGCCLSGGQRRSVHQDRREGQQVENPYIYGSRNQGAAPRFLNCKSGAVNLLDSAKKGSVK